MGRWYYVRSSLVVAHFLAYLVPVVWMLWSYARAAGRPRTAHEKAVLARATESGLSFHFTDTSFASALGGGLDVRVSPRIAVRAFQAEYVRTQLFGGTQNKGRIAFGVVFRLGQK